MSHTASGRRGLIAAAILCVLAPGLSVVSAAEPGPASRIVRYADLNLSDPTGAHVLYMRILAAAQVACGYYWFATDADKARCVLDATADAVTKVNEPALSAVFNATNRTPWALGLPSRSR